MKNKKLVAMVLLLLLLIHSSGLIRKTFTIMEGATWSQKEVEQRKEINIKAMQKMLKDLEKTEKDMVKKQKELGITEEEKRLTLKIIDKGISMAEQIYGTHLFRNKKSSFHPALQLWFTQTNYIKGKLESVYSEKKTQPQKLDLNDAHLGDFIIDGIERMRKIRNTIAKLKTMDGGSESLPDKSSGGSSEKSSEKSGSWL